MTTETKIVLSVVGAAMVILGGTMALAEKVEQAEARKKFVCLELAKDETKRCKVGALKISSMPSSNMFESTKEPYWEIQTYK